MTFKVSKTRFLHEYILEKTPVLSIRISPSKRAKLGHLVVRQKFLSKNSVGSEVVGAGVVVVVVVVVVDTVGLGHLLAF